MYDRTGMTQDQRDVLIYDLYRRRVTYAKIAKRVGISVRCGTGQPETDHRADDRGADLAVALGVCSVDGRKWTPFWGTVIPEWAGCVKRLLSSGFAGFRPPCRQHWVRAGVKTERPQRSEDERS
jgi:hypothetical protein